MLHTKEYKSSRKECQCCGDYHVTMNDQTHKIRKKRLQKARSALCIDYEKEVESPFCWYEHVWRCGEDL